MATSAEAPLIAHQEDHGPDNDEPQQHHDDGYADDLAQDGVPRGEEDRKVGLFMWLLAISAGISGLLFGCEFSFTPQRQPLRFQQDCLY